MARGDPVFTKFDNAIRHSRKIHQLLPDERWVYTALNTICTEERQDALLSPSYGLSYVVAETDVDIRIARRSLLHMAQIRLIELTDKWSILVYDVRNRHRKLVWKTRPIWPPNGETLIPHTGNMISPNGAISEIRDQSITTDPDTEIVTQRRSQPEPGPAGAVDVKKLLEDQDRKRSGEKSTEPQDNEPWNQVEEESELEREVHLWFLELWPHGEYEWEGEKDSVLSQVRTNGRGPYDVARGMLKEDRRAGKRINNELAYLNGIAREQAKKLKGGG